MQRCGQGGVKIQGEAAHRVQPLQKAGHFPNELVVMEWKHREIKHLDKAALQMAERAYQPE